MSSADRTDRYAVVGNPVAHSLSPRIHGLFAQQTDQNLVYDAIEIDLEAFEEGVLELRREGLLGLNVTVPFKQQAFELCDQLSPRARDAGAVNTILFTEQDEIVGDNTDGVGLTRDLIDNLHILIRHRKVLILGAGGAVRGVIGPLLVQQPRSLAIANRTLERAQTLADDFSKLGRIDVFAYDELGRDNYDLIINGTAAGLSGDVPPVPDGVLGINSVCYDMMYRLDGPTAFVDWALQRGAVDAHDGLGMLVEQAAEAFSLWRGRRPETAEVIATLRAT